MRRADVPDPVPGLRSLRETFIPYGPPDGEIEVVPVFGRDHTELKLREQALTVRLAELNTSEALKTAIVDHALSERRDAAAQIERRREALRQSEKLTAMG